MCVIKPENKGPAIYFTALILVMSFIILMCFLSSCERINGMMLDDVNDLQIAGAEIILEDMDEVSIELRKYDERTKK